MKLIKGIWFPDSDTHFEKVIDNEGNYQKHQFDTVMKHIKPEDRGLFIDVGAHVGLWSRMAIKAEFKQILAFEPSDDNYECLEKNLDQFDNSNNFLCNFALADKEDALLIKNEQSNNSGAKTLDEELRDDDEYETVLVQCFDENFSSIEEEFDLSKKNLIKIDVQGYEAKVVHGMTNFIKEYKPLIIVEQWLNGKEDLEATHYCQSLGMKILERVGKEIILGW